MSSMKFLKNLHTVASSQKYQSISWNSKGNGIIIRDKALFIEEALPLICKSDEYGTFIRQLNNYGFSKTKNHGVDEFINETFHKDNPDALNQVKRKHPSEKPVDLHLIQRNQNTIHSNLYTMNEMNKRLVEEVYKLKDKVDRHEKTINELVKAFITMFNKRQIKEEHPRIEGKESPKDSSLDLDLFLDDEYSGI
ncbi:hypothetical protein NEFER03_0176 [Nematocida sp. LUAm3]|nr:hypothetical protein NEFER03_0176 [Nematocida sp. LUAm3]KAI5173629.1 hypothetical protein NEFER02_0145 [Nematocida sp. LUAm2]KAI5176850.1 hypothetical protein NEFER01_0175 [Nematocida sp. LUAm1]